jgi:hypothetical protein
MIFLRFKIEILEIYLAIHLIIQGMQRGIHIPLSPPVEIQIELKPLKSYGFKGFVFLSHIKLVIHS